MKNWIMILMAGMTAMNSNAIGDSGVEKGGPLSAHGFEIVKITSEAGAKEAAYFDGDKDRIAIFVPGAVFDKESWCFLAEKLQSRHMASLSLDGKTKGHVLAAVEFAKQNGFGEIILVGGSMGGAAVLEALAGKHDESISKIVLLAPAGGKPVNSEKIDKLFIVAKQDRLGLYSTARDLYAASAEPKRFIEFEGSEHAQYLFKRDQHDALVKLIIDFISANE